MFEWTHTTGLAKLLAWRPGTIKFSLSGFWNTLSDWLSESPKWNKVFSFIRLYCSFWFAVWRKNFDRVVDHYGLSLGSKLVVVGLFLWCQSPLPHQRSMRNSAPEKRRSVLFCANKGYRQQFMKDVVARQPKWGEKEKQTAGWHSYICIFILDILEH